MSHERISELERRLDAQARELDVAQRELEAFSFAISHDLRAPLRVVDARLNMLAEDFGPQLDEKVRSSVESALENTRRMATMLDDLLRLARLGQTQPRYQPINLSDTVAEAAARLQAANPDRKVALKIQPQVRVQADPTLMLQVVEHLLSNAWKYTARQPQSYIEFGVQNTAGERIFFVRDNGAGFNMKYATKLFRPFQRMHAPSDFPGTGVGLAAVLRILSRHGGRIWAEAEVDRGATFYFTLGAPAPAG